MTFNLNGAESGTRPINIQLEVGETITAAELPAGEDFAKTGFIFTGWSDKANATSALESYTPTSVGTKAMYAVWVADKVTLITREGTETVIDDERGFIYGLTAEGITEEELFNTYLDVIGNGHLEIDTDEIGTGTVVSVINDFSGNVDATYTIVIFGDLTGDGKITNSDVTELRNINARVVTYPADSAFFFAADLTHDGQITNSDVTEIRNANARIAPVPQTLEEA